MEEIKTTFPFIYIKQIDSYFIFELTPDDLFVKRGDKNFFGVVFNKNNPTKQSNDINDEIKNDIT